MRDPLFWRPLHLQRTYEVIGEPPLALDLEDEPEDDDSENDPADEEYD